ncbi:MAG TPA: WD40 repeat domain-containing protein [Gemmataceae bacterium]
MPVHLIEAVESAQLTATLKGHEDLVWQVAWASDGKTLATLSIVNGEVKLWDVAERKERATLRSDLGNSYGLAFTPDGKTLVVGHYNNVDAKVGPTGSIALWDVGTGKRAGLIQDTPPRGVPRLAISPDGKTLAAVERRKADNRNGWRSQIIFRDMAKHTIERSIEEDYGTGLTFSPDGKTVVASTMLYEGDKWLGSKVRRWDATTGEESSSLAYPDGMYPSDALAFSPDGRTLAGPDYEGNIILWDTTTAKVRTTIKQEDQRRVSSLAFSPDGKTFAAAIGDRPGRGHEPGLIVVWDAGTGKRRLTLSGHTNAVLSVAFSPDGKLLASGSSDRTARLWDMTALPPTGKANDER